MASRSAEALAGKGLDDRPRAGPPSSAADAHAEASPWARSWAVGAAAASGALEPDGGDMNRNGARRASDGT